MHNHRAPDAPIRPSAANLSLYMKMKPIHRLKIYNVDLQGCTKAGIVILYYQYFREFNAKIIQKPAE